MQTILAARASKLSRKVYASLPFGYRLARFLLRLASGIVDAFGRVVAAEMIKRGVTDMPDIGSDPAVSWQEKLLKLGPRAGDALPRSYGRKFAQTCWNVGLAKTRKPDVVEEILTSVIEKLVSRPTLIHEGVTRAEAEAFILTLIKNEIIDIQRSKSRWQLSPLGEETEEGDFTGDMLDPESLQRLEDAIPASKLQAILRDLERVHPSASEYVRLMLDGYDKNEIAQKALLPHMRGPAAPQALTNWEKRWVPEIRDVFNRHLELRP